MEEREVRRGARVERHANAPSLFPDPAPVERDLLEGLNAPQREAVRHEHGPLLILAGPGSGKTRVITRRIAWLATHGGVDARRILAITFTNKAASEMRERVARLGVAAGAWIGTFHATCARILRRDAEMLPPFTRDFTIFDTHDRNVLLKQILKELDFDTTRFKPAQVGAWISERKNGMAGGLEVDRLVEGDDGFVEEALRKVFTQYDERLRAQNAMDFDDLLLRVLELFQRHPGARDAWAHRFEHVLVDEYQDTNRAQYLLARELASMHQNLAVCGDPDQSIYAWRGADLRNILDFEEDYPGAVVVKLEQNYRSSGNILAAAQAVIERNRARKDKGLFGDQPAGAKLVVLECADENDEAREIAQQIRALSSRGVSPRDVAVFYRTNFLQRALESQLRIARVAYQVVGSLEFYERREIRDLVAFAKLAVNPRDDVAFRRVVNVPSRGIGDKSVDELARFSSDRRIPMLDAARSSEARSRIKGRAKGGLEGFVALADKLATFADAEAETALGAILDAIDADAWYAEMEGEMPVDREENVRELLAHARSYDLETQAKRGAPEAPIGGLRGFLQEIALVSDTDDLDAEVEQVTLMTLHAAKGLEFPVVFIAGVEEELLPHARSIQDELDARGGGVEEERRLFYVGITRAKERVILTHARTRALFGTLGFRRPSRFLEEIPRELIEGFESQDEEADVLGAFAPSPAFETFEAGDRVEHAAFGRGVVVRAQGSGVNARVVVRFPGSGEKTLLLQYAKLERVGRGG